MARSETQLKTPRFLILAAVCVVVGALYFAQDVLIPLALATLFSFLLAPLAARLERRGLHRFLSVGVIMLVVVTAVLTLGWVVGTQLEDLAEKLPSYKDNITSKIRSVRGEPGGAFGKAARLLQDVKQAVSEAPTTPATNPSIAQSDRGKSPATPAATEPAAAPPPTTTTTYITEQSGSSSGPMSMITSVVGSVAGPLGTAGIVAVLVIFMLLQREDLRDRMIRLISSGGNLHVTTRALDDAAKRITRYLVAQAMVNGTYGIAIAIGLLVIGLVADGQMFPSFVLWGLLCTLLRFIPYIGPWIAAAFPLALAFAVYPGYGPFVAVIGLFAFIELLSNNLMEPWLYGASTGISSVAVIIAAVFWTWLWGTVGLLLSTPLTVCIVVIGKYVPQMAFLDVLLGDRPVLEPHERLYQRLLAMDAEEATDIAESAVETQPIELVYDAMLLPALAMAEQDRHAGRLSEERSAFIRQTIRDIVDELIDVERTKLAKQSAAQVVDAAREGTAPLGASNGSTVSTARRRSHSAGASALDDAPASPRYSIPSDCTINVLTLPAHDEADAIVGAMIAQLFELRGFCATAVSHDALASEMVEMVEKKKVDIVCVSALPPAAISHSRYLCKRLQTRYPNLPTIVGLWTVTADVKKIRRRIACTDTTQIVTTIAAALDQLPRITEPLIITNRTPAAAPPDPAQKTV